MNLTEEGLKQIEHYADKKRDAHIMLMVQILKEMRIEHCADKKRDAHIMLVTQILKEIRELRALFEQTGEGKYRKGGGRD